MNKVEILFSDKGINRHGLIAYPQVVAIKFIQECKKNNIAILGVDALLIEGNFTQPSMDDSIDFTRAPYKSNNLKNVWDIAIDFIKRRDPQYYYEIVCG